MEDDESEVRNVPRRSKAKQRNPNVEIKFDDKKRRDYLLGFHKRKNERRKVAKQLQEYKEKKARKEERKLRRETMKSIVEKLPEINVIDKREIEEYKRQKRKEQEQEAGAAAAAESTEFQYEAAGKHISAVVEPLQLTDSDEDT